MKMKLVVSFILISFLFQTFGYAQKQTNSLPKLSWDSFDLIRDRILPGAKETGWREIDWRNDFGQVLREATEKDLPILIWAMNGDPLGCT
jgi:hypothetical protein